MSKYWVHYTENCTPKLKSFTKEDNRIKFIADFLLANQGDKGGYFVDFTFEGVLSWASEDTTLEEEEKRKEDD